MPHSESKWGYPSVTQVLGDRPKPWLQKWKAKWGKRAEQKVAAANAIGTDFHRCVELSLDPKVALVIPRTKRVADMFRQFKNWSEQVNGEIHHTELKVVSHVHGYEGTLDAIGTLDGIAAIFDWKTSSAIYDDAELQLAAYAGAYEEMTKVKIKRGLIVLVSKDKPRHKLTVKEYKLTKRTLNKFLKRLEDFRKFNVKRKTNAQLGDALSVDGIQCNTAPAES